MDHKTEDYTRTHFQDLGARIGGAPIATGSSGRRRGSLLGGYPEPGEVRKRLRAFIYTRRVLVSAPWETGDGHSVHFKLCSFTLRKDFMLSLINNVNFSCKFQTSPS